MSEWDFENQDTGSSGSSGKPSAGPWDWAMTLVALLSVTAVSFLTARLTKDVPLRPFWMLGLSFAAPVATLLLSVFLKEKASSSMTPSTSRGAQLALVGCSILAAVVVGCFCQISNEQADVYEEVEVTEGWSDVFIVLDKSGSMYWSYSPNGDRLDTTATNAVIDLIEQMNENTRVGLLIDVGWEENNEGSYVVPLDQRLLPISPLTAEHRAELESLARCATKNNENFPRAFDTVCDILEKYDGTDGDLTIIVISDGQDITERFRAADYAGRLNARGVKVNYLYVLPEYSGEMKNLAELTGGSSIYVAEREALLEHMQQMVTVQHETVTVVYKDALRDIDESPTAKAVTGVLLLLLGLLIGFSLTVMFSLHGQKRFQMVLSPLMAALAFVILAFGKNVIPVPWIREGVAFSLFGIVLMRKNRITGYAPDRAAAAGAAGGGSAGAADTDW